jgi:hypothetical protein
MLKPERGEDALVKTVGGEMSVKPSLPCPPHHAASVRFPKQSQDGGKDIRVGPRIDDEAGHPVLDDLRSGAGARDARLPPD